MSFSECRTFLASELERIVSEHAANGRYRGDRDRDQKNFLLLPLLSPAHVSCVMQHHKECPWKATRSIVEAVADYLNT